MVRTDTKAVIAAFVPGGVMQYLPGLFEMPSREEIGNFYIGPIVRNVKEPNALARFGHQHRSPYHRQDDRLTAKMIDREIPRMSPATR
jgi:hypothetical protein